MAGCSDDAGRDVRRPSGPAVDPRLALDDFPIPTDAPAGGKGWSPLMIGMAGHIGAHATLLICDRFGGREVYIAMDPTRSPFRGLIADALIVQLHFVYCREVVAIPTARAAIDIARRAAVLAMVRNGTLGVAAAASIIGFRRDSMSRLVNRSNEGKGVHPLPLPVRRDVRLAAEAAAIATTHLARIGATPQQIAAARAEIMGLAR